MKPKLILLWHEPSNSLAVADMKNGAGGCPLITVFDDEFNGINPFYSYPLSWLLEPRNGYGWIKVGEL